MGLDNHWREQAAARRRVRESHDAQAKLMGLQPISGDDEMGDLVITGDIELDKSQKNGGIGKTLGAIALGATIPLAAGAGYLLANRGDSNPPPAVTVPGNEDAQNTLRPDEAP